MTKNRRPPINTASGSVDAMQSASLGPIEPPSYVKLRTNPDDRPHWDVIMRARSRDEWGKVELKLAGQLAQVMTDIDTQQAGVDQESYVIHTEKGTPIMNPRATALNTLRSGQLRLMMALRIVGNVPGDSGDELPRRKAEREAEAAISRVSAAATDEEPSLISTR